MNKIYRVIVMCEGWKDAARTKMVRNKVKILVEAKDAEEAWERASKHAYEVAPVGPKWMAFTGMEASLLTLPTLVASI